MARESKAKDVGSLGFASLLGPLRVHARGRVFVGEERSESRLLVDIALDFGERLLDLGQEALGDGLGGNDPAGLWGFLCSHGCLSGSSDRVGDVFASSLRSL